MLSKTIARIIVCHFFLRESVKCDILILLDIGGNF